MHDDWPAVKKLIWTRGRVRSGGLPGEYRRVKGFAFDGNTYYRIDSFRLTGHDTVKLSISVNASCNVFGCYTTTTADDNYSLYVSTASTAKYLRYDGSAYKSYWNNSSMGERFDISITPTGSHGMPSGQDDVWYESDFTATADMCIGTTSTGATSSKFKGRIYGVFEVAGRFRGIPCERVSDGVLGYYDLRSGRFYEPVGAVPESLGYDEG